MTDSETSITFKTNETHLYCKQPFLPYLWIFAMMSIDNLPPEVMLNIFELGCNDNPDSPAYNTFKFSIFKRLKHPFMTTVSATCVQWRRLSGQAHNSLFYFTYLRLTLDVRQSDQCSRFIINLTAYRNALLLSHGSNLFVEWTLYDVQSSRDSDIVLMGLFLHAMDMIPPYQGQLREVVVDVYPSAAISHLLSVRCDWNWIYPLVWTLRRHL